LSLFAGQISLAQRLCPLIQLRLPGWLCGGLRRLVGADGGA